MPALVIELLRGTAIVTDTRAQGWAREWYVQ